MPNNKVAPAIDKGVAIVSSEELKREVPDFLSNQEKKPTSHNVTKTNPWYTTVAPTILHYIVLTILGLLTWCWLWFAFGDAWSWDEPWFRLAIVVVIGWASGLALQSMTTLPPLLAALLTGILARNFGYLDMRDFTQIDVFLRKIYPVIILGKGSLSWDTNYMKANWVQIAALAVLPWIAEVATLATCMHFFLGHPWMWGSILGTFYASVSMPVVMPNAVRVGMSLRRTQNWPQFFATSGGVETALSVGMYGVLVSFLFSHEDDTNTHRYLRAFSSLFAGVALGVAWGCLAGLIPHSKDQYVVELRVLFVLFGALMLMFATAHVGWGGVAGVAVLACNATAARHWAKSGWTLNNNPASTAYRVMWSACEPAVFVYTGTFFVINRSTGVTILYGFVILLICMAVRLGVAALACWKLTLRERAFVCCMWSTKSIVEAVLCPTIINLLLMQGHSSDLPEEMQYAEDFVVLTVQEILITTPLAFLLTKCLGPHLIKDKPLEYGRNESSA